MLRQLQRPPAAALRRLLEERRRRRALQDLRVTPAQITAACPLLTRREAEVMSLLAEAKSDAEIGRALGMSHLTAGTHVANILRKLGAENRLKAALHVIRRVIATA